MAVRVEAKDGGCAALIHPTHSVERSLLRLPQPHRQLGHSAEQARLYKSRRFKATLNKWHSEYGFLALLGANPEKNIVEALNASGEKHLAFEATLKIRGQNYEVKVVTCEVPVCAKGNQVLHKGDVVTVYPVCGPSVYVIPALTELRSSVPEKVTTRPCKNTAVGAAQAVSKNANRAKSSVAEAEIFDNAYAAGKFDDESRYVSVTDPKTRKSQKYEILSKEDDGSLLVKTEGGKIDKIKPSEVSIKPNKAAKFYFKARENISADTLIKDAQKAEKNLERPSFSKAEVNKNAQLSDSQKISKLESLRQEMAKQNKIEIPLLTQVQKDAMAKVHEDGAQVFNLTLSQKKNRIRILKEAGYSRRHSFGNGCRNFWLKQRHQCTFF